ncbi:TPA: hypothetical protein IAB29_02245 [Candidatus Ventrenecus stercoripullorum]|nr:hypothetical protein [Candidatus Ventrenecus stercoripullorum]
MKKFLISIFVLFAFFGMIGTVEARELSRTCRYTDGSENSIVYLFVYSDGDSTAYIRKDRGSFRNESDGRGDPETDVNNWDSSKYSNSCPEYLAYNGRLDFGYSVHVGDTEESLDYRPGPILSLSNFDGIDATCSYDVNLSNGSTNTFTLTVYRDGFVVGDPLTLGEGGENFGPMGGINYHLGDVYEEMYNDAGQLRQCPILSFCEESSANVYEVKPGGTICSNGETGQRLTSHGTNNVSGIEEEEDQSRNVCSEPRYASDNISGHQYIIDFYFNQNGEKYFRVSRNDNTSQGGDAPYNGDILVDNLLFRVDPDYYDVYWEDCDSTEIYLRAPEGVYEVRQITGVNDEMYSTAPEDSNGFETDNTASIEEPDEPWNPHQVCQGDNCNISMEKICTDSNVSNTLHSIGILIVIIKVLVPAVIIIIGIKNLFMIITSGKEDDVKKYAKSIALRIIIGVGIFLLPSIINFIYDAAQDVIGEGQANGFDNCWNCLFDLDQCDTSGND